MARSFTLKPLGEASIEGPKGPVRGHASPDEWSDRREVAELLEEARVFDRDGGEQALKRVWCDRTDGTEPTVACWPTP